MTQIEEVLAMYYDENLTDNEIARTYCKEFRNKNTHYNRN